MESVEFVVWRRLTQNRVQFSKVAKINDRRIQYFSQEERAVVLNKIISYFLTERGEEIGVVAAGSLLDFFEVEVAPEIFNLAVDETRTITRHQLEELDLRLLEVRKDTR